MNLLPNSGCQKLKSKLFRWAGAIVGENVEIFQGVKVQGMEDTLVHFGKCCTPLPGDNIVGIVTRGRGIIVHTATCPKILDIDSARRVAVSWDGSEKVGRPVDLRIKTMDSSGLLAEISKTFTNNGVNILGANCKVANNYAINTFEISIYDTNQLRQLVIAIEQIKGVISVERISVNL